MSEPLLRERSVERGASAGPSPSRILDYSWGLARTATLVAALELDLFSEIADGHDTVAALTVRTGADQRGLRALLNALRAAELLHCDGEVYWLADDAAVYLVRDSPSYLGDLRHVHRELNFLLWPRLTEAVREGAPRREIFAECAEDVWAKVTPYLDALGVGAARWIARVTGDLVADQPRVLDVGCGYGGYGRSLAQAWGGTVDGVDREASVSAATRRAEDAGLSGRFAYWAADLFDGPWGGPYDVVLLSNVLHGYPPEPARELLDRAADALTENGVLLIYEIVPDDADTDPVGAFFSLEMLLTSEGIAHELVDYTNWLAGSGASVVRRHRSPTGPGTLIVAKRGANE